MSTKEPLYHSHWLSSELTFQWSFSSPYTSALQRWLRCRLIDRLCLSVASLQLTYLSPFSWIDLPLYSSSCSFTPEASILPSLPALTFFWRLSTIMFTFSANGLDGQWRPNFDSLGKLYVAIAVFWTAVLTCGTIYLVRNRHLPAMKVRNTRLWLSALISLHSYWVLCWCAYVLNGVYPCSAEYWIMSLWLPLGIALFQVNGMHLVQIAKRQERFMCPKSREIDQSIRRRDSCWSRLRGLFLPGTLSREQKLGIAIGLLLQVGVYSFSE